MAHPVPTKAFVQPNQEAATLLDAPTHLLCPTLSADAEPKSQGHCQK